LLLPGQSQFYAGIFWSESSYSARDFGELLPSFVSLIVETKKIYCGDILIFGSTRIQPSTLRRFLDTESIRPELILRRYWGMATPFRADLRTLNVSHYMTYLFYP
jgi:hypothetical protein